MLYARILCGVEPAMKKFLNDKIAYWLSTLKDPVLWMLLWYAIAFCLILMLSKVDYAMAAAMFVLWILSYFWALEKTDKALEKLRPFKI